MAARAATHPQFALRDLAAQLRTDQPGLTAFAAGDAGSNLWAVFSWSYRQLTPAAARLFRLLGVHPGRDARLAAVASLAGLPPAEVRPALADLTDAHLVTEQSPGRFTCHDLLHTYAAELAATIDTEAERQAAVRRSLQSYLHTAHAAALLINPSRSQTPLASPPPGHHGLALVLGNAGRHREALDSAGPALAIYEAIDDPIGYPRALNTIGWNRALLGEYEPAVRLCEQAVALQQRSGDRRGEAASWQSLGCAHHQHGRPDLAVLAFRQALERYQSIGDRLREAETLTNLGDSYAASDPVLACQCWRQAVDLLEQLGHPAVAEVRDRLGLL